MKKIVFLVMFSAMPVQAYGGGVDSQLVCDIKGRIAEANKLSKPLPFSYQFEYRDFHSGVVMRSTKHPQHLPRHFYDISALEKRLSEVFIFSVNPDLHTLRPTMTINMSMMQTEDVLALVTAMGAELPERWMGGIAKSLPHLKVEFGKTGVFAVHSISPKDGKPSPTFSLIFRCKQMKVVAISVSLEPVADSKLPRKSDTDYGFNASPKVSPMKSIGAIERIRHPDITY